MIRIIASDRLALLKDEAATAGTLRTELTNATSLTNSYRADAEQARNEAEKSAREADRARADARAVAGVLDETRRELAAARGQIAALEAAARDDIEATVLAARDLALEAAGFFRVGWVRDEEAHQSGVAADAREIAEFICRDADLPAVKARIAAVRRALSDIRARAQCLNRTDVTSSGTFFRDWKDGDYSVDAFLATARLYHGVLSGAVVTDGEELAK